MANTTTIKHGFITITGLDADWSVAVDAPDYANAGLVMVSIQFNPSQAGDTLIITDSLDAAGVSTPFHVVCSSSSDIKIKYFNDFTLIWPYIDITDCILGNAANAKVVMQFANWVGRPKGSIR